MTAVAHHPVATSDSPESRPPAGRTRRNFLVDAAEVVVAGVAGVAVGATFLNSDGNSAGEVASGQNATDRLRSLEAKEQLGADADKELRRIQDALNHKAGSRLNQDIAFRMTDGKIARGTVGVANDPNMAWQNPIYLAGKMFAGVAYTRIQGDGGTSLAVLVPFEGAIGAPAPVDGQIDNRGGSGPVVVGYVDGGILQVGVPISKA